MKVHCASCMCSLMLVLILVLHYPNHAYAQADTPITPTEAQRKQAPVSGNIALYTFLRAASVDDVSDDVDKARSLALLSEIGLTETDRFTLQNIFTQYSSALRVLQGDQGSTLSPVDLQKSEIRLYANVIHRIRAELSASGVQQLRSHLEIKKKTKMVLHTREESAK